MARFTSAFKALTHGTLNWDGQLDTDMGVLEGLANGATNVNSGNWNSITDPGSYFGGTMTNAPAGSGGFFMGQVHRESDSHTVQVLTGYSGTLAGITYVRVQTATGVWTAWRRLLDDSQDTGWVTSSSGMTAPSGFTLSQARYRSMNGVVSVGVVLTKTGSASATANAAGMVSPITITNLPTSLQPSQTNGFISNVGSTGTIQASGYASATVNALVITNLPASTAIPVGGVLDLMGTYLL